MSPITLIRPLDLGDSCCLSNSSVDKEISYFTDKVELNQKFECFACYREVCLIK